jgi:GrpB-like predicted nucleotidyltransferase (UPF0157 family)
VTESLEERVRRVLREPVEVVPYDPAWPLLFEEEKRHLKACLPRGLTGRIEHFGSTAVTDMVAKPIIDILVEVTSLEETKEVIVPILTAQGYEYFWRPYRGDDTPPFYAWFIKRDRTGNRTHHIHMVEKDYAQWDHLLFRDFLGEHRDTAEEYAALKLRLAREYRTDRLAYSSAKSEFINRITSLAKVSHRRA